MSNYYDVKQFVVPDSLKTSMNSVLNKKLGTTSVNYDPKVWAANVGAMVPLPVKTASGSIAHFEDGADDVPMKSVVANITPKQEGTGDPSPSNHRPISGTSVLNLTRAGKNLFDKNNVTFETGNIQSDGTIGTVAEYYYTDSYIRVKAETEYCFSGTLVEGSRRNAVAFYDASKTFLSRYLPSDNQPAKFTTPSNTHYIRFNVSTGYNVNDIQIEQGSTSTTYELYTGSTYIINLGRTFYGGTYNSETGVLTVIYGSVDLGSRTWTYRPASGQYTDYFDCNLPTDSIAGTSGVAFDGYCSIYKSIKSADIAKSGYDNDVMALAQGTRRFIVCDQRFTDKDDFVAGITGVALIYPLLTPLEIQLEPTEINSLLGVNNIWHDGNGDTEVEYRADIDILINNLGG